MRNLVPSFILEKTQSGEQYGQFEAVTLFVDTSGFTPLTARLTEQGRDGAELLANILHEVFEPLVRTVFAHGGYIAAFAGDGFKAVFPAQNGASYWRALAVAEAIRTHIAVRPTHITKYGTFDFTVRVSLAAGVVTWAIWSAENHYLSQSYIYTFSGSALDEATVGENYADGGQIITTKSVYRALVRLGLDEGTGDSLPDDAVDYVRIGHIANPLPVPQPIVFDNTILLPYASRFYPRSLLSIAEQGEFRPVYSLFVTVQRLPKPGDEDDFLPAVLELLQQYGGYLCRLSGEGEGGTFLFFWGAPSSHENDLDRVLNFLLKWRTMSNIPLKAGITHDLAYAGFVGSPLSEEYTCHGSRVIQAARQMKVAEWGQILLDEAAAYRAQDYFQVEFSGQYELKGLAGQQALFTLNRRRVRWTTQTFAVDLIGRTNEVQQLHQAVAPIFVGQFAGLTLITGEAGIGKSHLLEVFRQQLGERNVQTIHCQSDEILRESLNPWRYFLRRYFVQSPDADDDTNKAQFFERLNGLIKLTADEQLGSELWRTRSALGALVNLRWEGSLYEQLEPHLRFENIQVALKTLILAESLRQPLLLLLEDVHWLDDDSRQFLTFLMRNVADYPLAIVATTRPTPVDAEPILTAEMVNFELEIGGLDSTGITTLARTHLDGTIAPSLANLLTQRAEGNPFFAEQLLLYLQEQSLLVNDQHGWRLVDNAEQGNIVPDDVQAVLIARLDRLTHAVRQVVQTAAVLGREFSVQILSQMLRGDETLDEKVLVAQEADVWSALSELRYLFRHTLLRDAAYAMQLTARLRTLHQTAGVAIEQLYSNNLPPFYNDLAHHFDQADNNERAIHYLQLALQQANDQFRNAEALDSTERLLKRLSDPVAIAEVRVTQSRLLSFFGRLVEAQRNLQEAEQLVAHLPDKQAFMSVKIGLGAIYSRLGEPQKALETLFSAETLATELQDQVKLARVYSELANIYSAFNLDGKRAVDYALGAFSLLEEHGTERQINTALLGLGNSYRIIGDFVRARQFYDRSAELAKKLGDDNMLARCYGSISIIYALQENFVEAIAAMEQALVLAQAVGARVTLTVVYSNLGKMRLESGQHRRALPMLEQALRMAHETANKGSIAIVTSNIAEVHEKLGDLQQALSIVEDGLQRHEEIGDPRRAALGLSKKARILARMGRLEEAVIAGERGLPHLVEEFSIGNTGRLHGWMGVIYAKLGRPEEALQQCLALLDSVTATDINYVPGLNYLIVALVLIGTNPAQQNDELAPLLRQIAELAEIPNDIAANLSAAIDAAETAEKFELGIMARCEAARYWAAENAAEQARHLLSIGKALTQTHDLVTSANEVEAVCGELGFDFAAL